MATKVKTTLRDEIGEFTAIPDTFLKDRKQTPESRLIFVYLRYHRNGKTKRAFPGYQTLIKESGLSRQKVAKGIAVLNDTGWLVKHKQFAKCTEYELRYPERLSSIVELRDEPALVPPRNSLSSIVELPPLSIPEPDRSNQTENTARALRAARVRDTGRLMAFLVKKNGPIPNTGAQAKAIKWLLENNYSVQDCQDCLEYLTDQPWRGGASTWITVQKEIGAWMAKLKKAAGVEQGGPAAFFRPKNWSEAGIKLGDPSYKWHPEDFQQ